MALFDKRSELESEEFEKLTKEEQNEVRKLLPRMGVMRAIKKVKGE